MEEVSNFVLQSVRDIYTHDITEQQDPLKIDYFPIYAHKSFARDSLVDSLALRQIIFKMIFYMKIVSMCSWVKAVCFFFTT
jgi:hypothetical protein